MSSEYRGHAIQLFVPPEVRSGIIQYMAKNDLDKEFACQILLLKALRSEGLISQEIFEKYTFRYSRKITPEVKPQMLTLSEQRERQKLEEMARLFGLLLPNQWDLHPVLGWRQRWLMEAEKWKDSVPEAKAFLEKFSNKILIGAIQK